MLYYSRGSEHDNLSADDLKQGLYAALEKLGKRHKVLALPPDITRLHSRAGELTRYAWQYYGKALTDVLPALGTHFAMTGPEIKKMFGEVPAESLPRARLAQRLRHAGRGPGLLHPGGQRGQARLVLARAGEQAASPRAGIDLILSLGPGRAARGHRHGQLQQERLRRHRRLGGHQQEPLPRRRLRHGADHGPGRYARSARCSTTPPTTSPSTCRSSTS